jgi:4-phytase/acid phosphatase
MNCTRPRKAQLFRFCVFLFVLSWFFIGVSSGQGSNATDDDEVRSVIVLARHGIRAPIKSETRSSAYNVEPWPSWPVQPGVLTPHGEKALRLLGDYYRVRYVQLLPNSPCEKSGIYAEANTTQRTIASAHAFVKGLRPDCQIEVHYLAESDGKENPLYMPVLNDTSNRKKLAEAINGRMNGRPDWFTDAFKPTLIKMRSILTECNGGNCDRNKLDLLAEQELIQAASGLDLVDTDGPVTLGADFAENFLLEYTEGLPMSDVGWGRVSRDDLNQFMEMNTRYHDFLLRTPFFAQVGASEIADRIRNTLKGAASGKPVERRFGSMQDHFVLLVGHDSNLAWLGGLLRLDWLLPDETFNATPPGSGLVFELHHNRISDMYSVQVLFISQTLDEMRNLRALVGSEQPTVVPVFVPGCSGPGPAYACSLEDFDRIVISAIHMRFVSSERK